MRLRTLLALLIAFAASGAWAQDATGVWAFDLINPEAGETLDSGFLIIAPSGDDGRMTLDGQGLDATLSGTTLTASDGAFTYVGTFVVGGGGPPFSMEGTVEADELTASLKLGDSNLSIEAGRVDMETMEEAMAANAPPIEPVKDLFEPFDLPTPNVYRSASGRPGPQYWQQEADYKIAVSLDPATHTVSGEVVLSYTNNSPEDLDKMWFQLEQNLFVPSSRGASAGSRADGATLDARNGYRLGTITVDGKAVTPMVDDTRMRLDLMEPIAASGGTVEVKIPFSFRVPEGSGTPRMGRLDVADGTIYSMAQWYPRVAVFDDVNGWNNLPYLGSGEFYLEYGDFDLALTVPANMQVVSTGALQNPDDVYSREQRQRLDRARTSEDRVYIVTQDEIGTTGPRSGMTTWRFRAENVRDVAWGASAAFIVDAANAIVPHASGETTNVLAMSAYPKEGLGTPEEPGWEEATRFGKASIENNSYWFAYPYPVAISVASHIGGMEYPMLHFSSVRSRHFGLFGVIDHELGHNWFPMIVGSDERRHAWMDEGFNTFINGPSAIKYYNENEDTSIAGYGQAERTQGVSLLNPTTFARLTGSFGSGDDEILTYADQLSGQEGGWNSYFKPGMGLNLLRTAVLGEERFDRAFKAYIERWAYKHPQPADFFRTIEDVSGEDLDWFWRGWFDTVRTYDAQINDVDVQDDVARVTVSHVSGLVFPTTVQVTFADGSTARMSVPVEGFAVSEEVTIDVPTSGREVTSARLDPDGLYPDVDRENDEYVLEEME